MSTGGEGSRFASVRLRGVTGKGNGGSFFPSERCWSRDRDDSLLQRLRCGFCNFPRSKASCANLHSSYRPILKNSDRFKIRIPDFSRHIMGMADTWTTLCNPATDCAFSCHNSPFVTIILNYEVLSTILSESSEKVIIALTMTMITERLSRSIIIEKKREEIVDPAKRDIDISGIIISVILCKSL